MSSLNATAWTFTKIACKIWLVTLNRPSHLLDGDARVADYN